MRTLFVPQHCHPSHLTQVVGVSFVSIFIVSYHLVFWVCGAAHSLSWDYLPGVPQGDDAERHSGWKEKPLGAWFSHTILCHAPAKERAGSVLQCGFGSASEKEKQPCEEGLALSSLDGESPHHDTVEVDPDVQLVRRTSRISAVSQRSLHPSLPPPHSVLVPPPSPPSSSASTIIASPASPTLIEQLLPPALVRTLRPLGVIFTPVTCTIAVSLPIALVSHLKALFVDVSNAGGPNWKGPDGKPPLAFVIDTGVYGSATHLVERC